MLIGNIVRGFGTEGRLDEVADGEYTNEVNHSDTGGDSIIRGLLSRVCNEAQPQRSSLFAFFLCPLLLTVPNQTPHGYIQQECQRKTARP